MRGLFIVLWLCVSLYIAFCLIPYEGWILAGPSGGNIPELFKPIYYALWVAAFIFIPVAWMLVGRETPSSPTGTKSTRKPTTRSTVDADVQSSPTKLAMLPAATAVTKTGDHQSERIRAETGKPDTEGMQRSTLSDKLTEDGNRRGHPLAVACLGMVFVVIAGFVGYAMRPTREDDVARYQNRAEAAERELAELKARAVAGGRNADGEAVDKSEVDETRLAAKWVLRVGGTIEVLDADKLVYSVSTTNKLPTKPFRIVGLSLEVANGAPDSAKVNLAGVREHLVAFQGVLWIRLRIDWYLRNAQFLAELPRLESVTIHGPCGANDIEALRSLAKLTRLTVSQFPANGYAHLKNLKYLRFLSIQAGSEVNDELLSAVKELPTLNQVELRDSVTSRRTANVLKAFRPNLEVTFVTAKGIPAN